MSQAQKTLVGLAVLVAIAGALALGAFKSGAQAERATQKKQRATTLVPDAGPGIDFSRLAITFEGTTTALSRQSDGGWQLTAPLSAKADKQIVDGVLSQLRHASFKATLDEHPDQAALQKFGLAPPVFAVEAHGLADGQPRTVLLEGGVENTFDGSIFMRRDGAPTVYSAEGGVRYAMARTTFDLRDKQVLAFDEPSLTSVRMKSATNDWAMARSPDGLWAFSNPVEAADPAPLASMLALLGAQRAQAFPTVPVSRFEHPTLEAVLTPKRGAPVRLRFVDQGATTLLLREDGEGTTTAELAAQTGSQLDRPRAELKDPLLARFKKELVVGLELSSPSGKLVLRREAVDAGAQSWRVVEPTAGPAKILKVSAVIWTLSTLRAKTWLPKALPAHGLDARARTLTFFGADGQVLARFTIGNAGSPGTVVVRGAGDHLAEVDADRLADLPWTVGELLDEPLSDAGRPTAP